MAEAELLVDFDSRSLMPWGIHFRFELSIHWISQLSHLVWQQAPREAFSFVKLMKELKTHVQRMMASLQGLLLEHRHQLFD